METASTQDTGQNSALAQQPALAQQMETAPAPQTTLAPQTAPAPQMELESLTWRRLRELTTEQVGTFVYTVLKSEGIDESVAEICKGYAVKLRLKGCELVDYGEQDWEQLGHVMTGPRARTLHAAVQ
eukprot:COSAG04_NODE_13998_length_584_cov_0.793814_1_plen_126_part_10